MLSSIYEHLIRPFLFRMDPEAAHELVLSLAAYLKLLAPAFKHELVFTADELRTQVGNTVLTNPVGIAAGLDKNGRLVGSAGHLGFGFEEVGSITALPCQGNKRPRLFRLLPDRAIINRLGLPSQGAKKVAQSLSQCQPSLPLGLNIARSNLPDIKGDRAVADMVDCFRQLHDLECASYIVFNASCPNTHEGCLQAESELNEVLMQVSGMNQKSVPLFIKLSPDSSDELLSALVSLAETHNLCGFVCGNTTTARDGLTLAPGQVEELGAGGLSGPPLKRKAIDLCRRVYALSKRRFQIIGCGGVESGDDALEFIEAGACAVQVYTALVYQGPALAARINRELWQLLKDKQTCLSDAIGKGEGALAN